MEPCKRSGIFEMLHFRSRVYISPRLQLTRSLCSRRLTQTKARDCSLKKMRLFWHAMSTCFLKEMWSLKGKLRVIESSSFCVDWFYSCSRFIFQELFARYAWKQPSLMWLKRVATQASARVVLKCWNNLPTENKILSTKCGVPSVGRMVFAGVSTFDEWDLSRQHNHVFCLLPKS